MSDMDMTSLKTAVEESENWPLEGFDTEKRPSLVDNFRRKSFQRVRRNSDKVEKKRISSTLYFLKLFFIEFNSIFFSRLSF